VCRMPSTCTGWAGGSSTAPFRLAEQREGAVDFGSLPGVPSTKHRRSSSTRSSLGARPDAVLDATRGHMTPHAKRAIGTNAVASKGLQEGAQNPGYFRLSHGSRDPLIFVSGRCQRFSLQPLTICRRLEPVGFDRADDRVPRPAQGRLGGYFRITPQGGWLEFPWGRDLLGSAGVEVHVWRAMNSCLRGSDPWGSAAQVRPFLDEGGAGWLRCRSRSFPCLPRQRHCRQPSQSRRDAATTP
jgi:hypothetical protein